MTDDVITVEYYADPLSIRLIGAVNVPRKRMKECAQDIGKRLCRMHNANDLEACLIDREGEMVDKIVIYR